MQISKVIFGLIWAAQSLHAMQGVKEKIDDEIEFIRINNNYDATLVPEGFDSKNCGEIIRYEEDEEHKYAFTHIGNVYHYDTTIEDGKPIGWNCIYQIDPNETPKTFEQSFNTAERHWQHKIHSTIQKNLCLDFAYNKLTKTYISSFTKLFQNHADPYHTQLIIEQNQKQQVIEILGKINKIACNNDSQYCAYGRDEVDNYVKSSYYSVKILKKSSNGLYKNADDMLTKGDNATTQSFDLIKKDIYLFVDLKNLRFLSNNSVQVHTVIPFDDKDYLWTITPEGVKTKQECFVDLGENQLLSLGKIYHLPSSYKKVSKSPYRYSINDPRFLAFIKIEKDRNSDILEEKSDIVQEKKVILPKELYAKIMHTWYEVDPVLRENTALIYDYDLSKQVKQLLKQYI